MGAGGTPTDKGESVYCGEGDSPRVKGIGIIILAEYSLGVRQERKANHETHVSCLVEGGM